MDIDPSKPIFITEHNEEHIERIQNKLDELGFGKNRLYDADPDKYAKIGDYIAHIDLVEPRLIIGFVTQKRPNSFTFSKIKECML